MGNINKIQKRKKKSLSPWSFTTILVFGLVLYYPRSLPALLVYRKKTNNFISGFLNVFHVYVYLQLKYMYKHT